MARRRQADSAAAAEAVDLSAAAPDDHGLIDPLKVASEGLEDVEEEPSAQPHDAADTAAATADPLALLSLAIDEEEALAAGDPVVAREPRQDAEDLPDPLELLNRSIDDDADRAADEPAPRRGLFGRRPRGRDRNADEPAAEAAPLHSGGVEHEQV